MAEMITGGVLTLVGFFLGAVFMVLIRAAARSDEDG